MRTIFMLAILTFGLGNADPDRNLVLSGAALNTHIPEDVLKIGVVADSQLQSRETLAANVLALRGKFEDSINDVAIRPPALDWSARAMLRAQLGQLAQSKVSAIFYLGDGANNGCTDEFSAGYAPKSTVLPNKKGILALLDEFRRPAKIPVFFVLGNHDYLGAGNTSYDEQRKTLCGHSAGNPNLPLTKYQVIEMVDRFNRENHSLHAAPSETADQWIYRSNFNAQGATGTKTLCEKSPRHHRNRGCYLAATVGRNLGGRYVEMLLLDSNDYDDVTESKVFGKEFEGLRGAMSFRDEAGQSIPSQTKWFEDNSAPGATMRIAMMHYDLGALQKSLPVMGYVSSKAQKFANIFTAAPAAGAESPLRTRKQDSAYVLSAHTHAKEIGNITTQFKVKCKLWYPDCKGKQSFLVREINTGSTTDVSNYATIFGLQPREAGRVTDLLFERLSADRQQCDRVNAVVANHMFRNPVGGVEKGWAAIGVTASNPHAYRDYGDADLRNIFHNLDDLAGENAAMSVCIGLESARVESIGK